MWCGVVWCFVMWRDVVLCRMVCCDVGDHLILSGKYSLQTTTDHLPVVSHRLCPVWLADTVRIQLYPHGVSQP